MNSYDEEDLELIGAVKSGDSTAYRGLFEKYRGRVYEMVYELVDNDEDAQDLTQDTFVKAYVTIKSFQLKLSFSAWLCRIAGNLTNDFIRKRKR